MKTNNMKKKIEIAVVRLSRRGYRDLRITTHCCLVARAFGAQKIFLEKENSPTIEKTVSDMVKRFGGIFRVEYVQNTLKQIKKLKKEGFQIVHLTMYGEPVKKHLSKMKGKMAVVIGADKVPSEIYQLADFNIGITRQPHSEVAALGVFLHCLLQGEEEKIQFKNAKIKIIPAKKGKHVTKINRLQD
jgi:tRNA (cytidine56-2'-O)-methyltransferase